MKIVKHERTTRTELLVEYDEDQIVQLIKNDLVDSNVDLRKAKSVDIQFSISQSNFENVSVHIVFETIEEDL